MTYQKKIKTRYPKKSNKKKLETNKYELNLIEHETLEQLLENHTDNNHYSTIKAIESLFNQATYRIITNDPCIEPFHPIIQMAAKQFDIYPSEILFGKSDEALKARLWITIELNNKGMTHREIGKILHKSHTYIGKFLNENSEVCDE